MDAATLQQVERLIVRLCSLSDVDAAQATLVAQGKTPITAGRELAEICKPGGQADRLAAALEGPGAAEQYAQKIAAMFAPFADILLAIKVTGDGERREHKREAATLAKAQAKADRMAEKKQHGGIYYTEDGRKIHGAERISRSEAAQLLNFHKLTVTAICRRGEIAHVYADPACTIPCGYTRASVEAWAQAHPRHIQARKAQAVPDFMITPLPPPPRNHGLRADREIVGTSATAEPEAPDATPAAAGN